MEKTSQRALFLRYLDQHPRLRSISGKMYDTYVGLGLPPLLQQSAPAAERAESEWEAGVWDYLARPHELGRYSLLAGYCRYFGGADSRILDLGCGEGLMRGQLDQFSQYVGIDISPTAVERAGQRWQDDRTSFLVGDFTVAPSTFDIVIANEILQILPDPDAFLEGVYKLTEPGGHFLVSIHHDTPRNRRLWRRIHEGFSCVDAVRVKSENCGRTWRVACYRKLT
jgi:SAM-dependent methyltransferase